MELHAEPEVLRHDADFTLYRGVWDLDGSRVLALRATTKDLSPSKVDQLHHEYALRDELTAAGALRPRAFLRDRERPTLILEDRGGQLLARGTGRPWDLRALLHVAIGVGTALGQLHERGLIHKDVKPGNIFTDFTSGTAWLTGFGIASRLPRERRVPDPPEIIAGTLAYMAPEQTGRMNRSLDSRGDLYTLGVTLYELLTGRLPFNARDASEWVHCHIARQPEHPRERAPGLDDGVCSVVLKLLAKSADERYQTAAGLVADLRRCLEALESTGHIAPFSLGRMDPSDRLHMPGKLYGRDRESEMMLEAFARVARTGAPEVVLVSGYSGAGKSSVILELQKTIVPPQGFFASGKVDQYKRDLPYAALAEALSKLVRQILARGESELARYRSAMTVAIERGGQLVVDLVPELELVIGPQPAALSVPPHEERARLWSALRRFVGVFASAGLPLVLFIDDLQWLDAATLEWLAHLVTHPDVHHLLLIGAYRDNEVGASHPVARMVESVRASPVPFTEITLPSLSQTELGHFLADALRSDTGAVEPLARVLHEKTGGNPFFATEFLTALADERLLYFDGRAARWRWELELIREKASSENVVELMIEKLHRLPEETQEVLKDLACLGHGTETRTLAGVRDLSEGAVLDDLWPAVQAGLVFRQEGAVTFLHDRAQEAAYELIAQPARASQHLRIGRRLLAETTPENLADNAFDVVGQLNRAAALLTTFAERQQLAELNLLAARKAKAVTAHASTLAYVEAGVRLLGDDGWVHDKALAFELALEHAESDYVNGTPEHGLSIARELLERRLDPLEKASVYRLKMLFHVMRAEYREAVQTGLECLAVFGVTVPTHPTREQARADYEVLRRSLGERSVESLVELPLATDPEVRAVALALSTLIAPALFVDSHLFYVVVCRLVSQGLSRGMSEATLHGFSGLAQISGPVFHRYDDGLRFAEIARRLGEAYRMPGTKGFFAMEVASIWTQPIAVAIDFIRRAQQSATDTGDVSYACYSSVRLVTDLLVQARDLNEAAIEAERGIALARKVKFRDSADMLVCQHRFIQSMRGETLAFGLFGDATFDEDAYEQDLAGTRMSTLVAWYWILKLQARFMCGDHAAAEVARTHAALLLPSTESFLQSSGYWYYAALNTAATSGSNSQSRAIAVLAIEESLAHLRLWAASCPETFSEKVALVSAELARVEARDLDAMRLYDDAIRGAHGHGSTGNEALANELAGRFHARRGFETIALGYLRNARACYERWGARGKVRQLERLYPALRDERHPLLHESMIGARVEELDLATVVRMSQVVSGEIVLERLVEKLMTMAIEHAGATRGVLVLVQGDEYRVEADALISGTEVRVRHRNDVVTPEELPDTIIRLAVRLRDVALLEDATGSPDFSSDPYIRRTRPRSVLCLPLLKQNALMGVLYLENQLTPHAFTPSRVGVLRLLASQAAISLENARLYGDLQGAVTRARASLDDKEALLKEVHHRVKNNLQLVSSLLNLQASRITDQAAKEMFEDSRNRVRSIASVHENLYRTGNFAKVPMAAHVESLCSQLARTYRPHERGIRFVRRVHDVHLEVGRAVACGLIVNELVSNALRHAFPPGRSGNVRVELDPVGDGRHALRLSDDGIGLPTGFDFGSADSLGLQLVHDLARQLGATVEVGREAGTTFTVTFDEVERGRVPG